MARRPETHREGVSIRGLGELRKALRKVDLEASKAVAANFRVVGRLVRDRARSNAPVKSGALKRDIRSTVTAKRAAIFATLPYAPVQERGGRVGNGAIIPRSSAKRYMKRAVDESRREVDASVEAMLDLVERAWK